MSRPGASARHAREESTVVVARAVDWLLGRARKKVEARRKVGRARLWRERELGWSWAARAKIKGGREEKIKLLSYFPNTFSNPI